MIKSYIILVNGRTRSVTASITFLLFQKRLKFLSNALTYDSDHRNMGFFSRILWSLSNWQKKIFLYFLERIPRYYGLSQNEHVLSSSLVGNVYWLCSFKFSVFGSLLYVMIIRRNQKLRNFASFYISFTTQIRNLNKSRTLLLVSWSEL